jgi:porphobilinogen synthase
MSDANNKWSRLSMRRRPRRLRQTASLRALVCETTLLPEQLILPMFICEGTGRREAIEAMPGCDRLSVDLAIERCNEAMELGVSSFAVFPVVDALLKTPSAQEAVNPDNLNGRMVRAMRAALPNATLITDIALDPYSSLGHDGLVSDAGEILNDETVAMLCEMAVLHARAGATMVAPSDMMDGRIGAIRDRLDAEGFEKVLVMSYCAKYASSFYGPFRHALESAPAAMPNVPSDKKTYQMDCGNAREAMIEVALDEDEGADIVMVKPAMAYLDVICRLREATDLPIAAYQVSGEYAMIQAAAQRGWIDGEACMIESLMAIRRAGADCILTYAALDYARSWRKSRNA